MDPSKCPRCGGENFEVRELASQDSKPKLAVRCAACGTVVQVLNCGPFKLNELTQKLGYRHLTE